LLDEATTLTTQRGLPDEATTLTTHPGLPDEATTLTTQPGLPDEATTLTTHPGLLDEATTLSTTANTIGLPHKSLALEAIQVAFLKRTLRSRENSFPVIKMISSKNYTNVNAAKKIGLIRYGEWA
jgi:hypothetical protein